MKPELRLNQDLLNAMLPDLAPEAEAELKARIRRLARQEEEKPVKKKLSVGLALALVMTPAGPGGPGRRADRREGFCGKHPGPQGSADPGR